MPERTGTTETGAAVVGYARAGLGETEGSLRGGFRLAEDERHTPPAALRGKARWLSAQSRLGVALFETLDAALGVPGDAERTGLFLATASGPLDARRLYAAQIHESGKASPTFFTGCGHNVAGGLATTALGLRGANLCFVGERGGWQALESALLLLELGLIDTAYVGRIDEVPGGGAADREAWLGAALALRAGEAARPRLMLRQDGRAEIHGARDRELDLTLGLLLGTAIPVTVPE